jgi:Bacterial Ig-like domain (group 3)/FG-GAP-like repeat
MRTNTQLKIFFAGVLIVGTALAIVTASAQVMVATQHKRKNLVAVPREDSVSAEAKRHGGWDMTAANSVSFMPVVTYGSGGFPGSAAAVADVNGDGKPDLVAANSYACSPPLCSSGTVGVLLGKGDGTFQAPVSYGSGGAQTDSIAIADVNGDGKPDVVVANFYASTDLGGSMTGTVGVLLGKGDGTFQAPLIYSSGGYGPSSIAVADVNNDGRPDLLVANRFFCGSTNTACVAVLLGNGDGTFQAAVTNASGPEYGYSVVAADVNGDGKPDLLVGSTCILSPYNCADLVGVLLGNGDGTFQTVVTYNSGEGYQSSVQVADINGDGKLDLLLANLDSNTVGVLLGNGDGTFQAVVTFGSTGQYAESVAAADVDGDGKPDLLVLNEVCGGTDIGCIGVLLGNGDGTFQPAVTYGSGGEALSMAVADLNSDAKPDVVVANYSVLGVLLNNTRKGKSPTSTSLVSSLNPSIYGQKVTWTATVTTSGSITPTGIVRFTWGGYTIGSAILNSGGVATLTRANLNAGTFPLTAVYLGDAANVGSTSAVVNQVVVQTTSSATLTSSPNPSAQGQAVTFTAKISSPTVIPKGPVTFKAGTTVLGTAQLSGGKATLAISSLPVGSTVVTVTYGGNSNIAKSSASVTQIVQ